MPDDRGWRLPAGRTEEAVTAAALQMLSNRGALASTLKPWPFCIELKQAIEAIDSKVKTFRQIGTMEESQRDGLQITPNLGSMLRPDQFPHGGATMRMTRLVPLQLRRLGVETRMVIPEKRSPPPGRTLLCFEHWHAAIGGSANWPLVEPLQPNRSRMGKA